MSSDMLGASARQLHRSLEAPGEDWQDRWARFEQYHQLWLRHGFYRMFSRLMAHEGVRSRLLRLPDGERRLTNLLHLAELLHEASEARQLGPDGVLKWLAGARQESAAAAEDEQKLRLESDAHAVRIITIHKSKGLQFEVVFCPFLWAPAKVGDQLVSFHDPEVNQQLTLAIGPGIAPDHRRLALEETLAENIRLMYVALTRARRRCYMVWGSIRGTELSAPAYLLHAPPAPPTDNEWLSPLKTKMAGMSDADLVAELEGLAAASQGTIRVEPLPHPSSIKYEKAMSTGLELTCRKFNRNIDTHWRIASFSSMTANPSEPDRPDRDETWQAAEPSASGFGPDDLFGFPKGVRAGLFFHDLLEHWNPGAHDAQITALVSAKLASHGYTLIYAPAVERFLDRLSGVRLPAGNAPHDLSLSQVAPQRRINEMAFYFPINSVSADQLKEVFRDRCGNRFSALAAGQVERLSFAPMHGFLKGYVDAVFEHGGRYYLVDWKSNHLGNCWADYDSSRLGAVMAESFYFLQAHLYALALDLMLAQRLPDYAYERHFGGVYYLFLRGIQGSRKSTGIHYMLPEAGLMTALKDTLLGRQDG